VAYRFKADRNLSRQFRDLGIGMKSNPNTEDFSVVKNENAIKQSMKNLLLTEFGERPFQPTTGSRVRSMLFENFDIFMIEGLNDEIRNTLKRLEPRVIVNDVRCNVDNDNELQVEIDYTIIGEQLVQTIDFLLEKA
jgi:phage baseplate assembly protein W